MAVQIEPPEPDRGRAPVNLYRSESNVYFDFISSYVRCITESPDRPTATHGIGDSKKFTHDAVHIADVHVMTLG